MHQASYYHQEKEKIQCDLCYHHCLIADGRRGICGVRENRDGVLYCLNYGKLVAENVDPVEKKPVFHVLPGTYTYSISTLGCNFRCKHCQNHSISQLLPGIPITGSQRSAEQVVSSALQANCESISYTYVEPTIFYEFAYECCVLANERNLKNIFVSNGYMEKEPARKIAPVLDAINIDVKAFSDSFYKEIVGAKLKPVLDSVELMLSLGVWVEVTTLLIPGLNDSREELEKLAAFLLSMSPDIPWHLTAFHPSYKMTNVASTTAKTLITAQEIGKNTGLNYVYLGNLPGTGEGTQCLKCGKSLIDRYGFSIRSINIMDGACPDCGFSLPGVW